MHAQVRCPLSQFVVTSVLLPLSYDNGSPKGATNGDCWLRNGYFKSVLLSSGHWPYYVVGIGSEQAKVM